MIRGNTSNLRRSTHLITLCFVLIIGGLAAVAVVSRSYSADAVSKTTQLTQQLLPATVELGKLQQDVSQLSALNLKVSMAPDEKAMNERIAAFQDMFTQADTRFAALTEAIHDEEFSAQAAKAAASAQTYKDAASKFQAAMMEGDFATAMSLLDGDVATAEADLAKLLNTIGNDYINRALASAASTGEVMHSMDRFGTWSSSSMAVTALFFAVVAITMSRRVSSRLGDTSGRLADAARVVDEKAAGLAESSSQLAESASEQAATIEETTASVEGITASMQRIASDAEHSKQLTGDTRNEAVSCATSMEEMRTAMAEVKQSSDKIARIIKTIDEIAFQTNLLALNAAVEAARAGDAGAGFAVVAEEVRALAHRSADAARETATTIEDALKRTDRSVQLTEKVSGGLDSMVEHTHEVNEIMANIATACKEQNESLNQLRDGVSQINEVTQRSAASADAESEASALLNEQAGILTDSVEELFAAVGTRTNRGARHAQITVAPETSGSNTTWFDADLSENGNAIPQLNLARR